MFDSFLRVHTDGTEDEHNTDAHQGDVLNDEKTGAQTNLVEMAYLDNLINIGGFAFYEFALDIDESAKPDGTSRLSLDQLKICSSNDGTLLRADDCPADPESYSLDLLGDRAVMLDYSLNGSGNGTSDLFVYIPYQLVHSNNTYFYLYSSFGEQPGAASGTAGFEEWAYQSRVGVDPQLICGDTGLHRGVSHDSGNAGTNQSVANGYWADCGREDSEPQEEAVRRQEKAVQA